MYEKDWNFVWYDHFLRRQRSRASEAAMPLPTHSTGSRRCYREGLALALLASALPGARERVWSKPKAKGKASLKWMFEMGVWNGCSIQCTKNLRIDRFTTCRYLGLA